MSKTSVARRNRSWRNVGAAYLASNYNPREELKYPKFGNFLYQLGKMEWTGSTAHSIEHFGSVYRIQKEFVLDGIHVKTYFINGHISASKRAKSDPHRYKITVFGESRKFEDSPSNDSDKVVKRGLKWLWEKHFSYHKSVTTNYDFEYLKDSLMNLELWK